MRRERALEQASRGSEQRKRKPFPNSALRPANRARCTPRLDELPHSAPAALSPRRSFKLLHAVAADLRNDLDRDPHRLSECVPLLAPYGREVLGPSARHPEIRWAQMRRVPR